MRKRPLPPIPDDGLVTLPGGKLVTPEAAHRRAVHIMAGFDELPPMERHAWNYAPLRRGFNGSAPVSNRKGRTRQRAVAAIGARLLLDEAGI
jgi:hypothetical protein